MLHAAEEGGDGIFGVGGAEGEEEGGEVLGGGDGEGGEGGFDGVLEEGGEEA